MGLRIHKKASALNRTRLPGRSTRALKRRLERLSGAFRINRAADGVSGPGTATVFNTEDSGETTNALRAAPAHTRTSSLQIRALFIFSMAGTLSAIRLVGEALASVGPVSAMALLSPP